MLKRIAKDSTKANLYIALLVQRVIAIQNYIAKWQIHKRYCFKKKLPARLKTFCQVKSCKLS